MQEDIDAYLKQEWDYLTRLSMKDRFDEHSRQCKIKFGFEEDFWAETQKLMREYVTIAHQRWAQEPGASENRRQKVLEQAKKEVMDKHDHDLLKKYFLTSTEAGKLFLPTLSALQVN